MSMLLVIDGDNLVHRCFHAPSNKPAHEVFGYALGRFRRAHAPSHAVVVWDCDGPTWRHERWPAYKADRPPRPPGLTTLLTAARQECRNARIAQAMGDVVEADDLIASYVEAGVREGLDVTIVSGDKDMLQLVRDTPTVVRMLDEVRGKTWGPAETRERWGVWPHSIADLLALIGDKSDGYPRRSPDRDQDRGPAARAARRARRAGESGRARGEQVGPRQASQARSRGPAVLRPGQAARGCAVAGATRRHALDLNLHHPPSPPHRSVVALGATQMSLNNTETSKHIRKMAEAADSSDLKELGRRITKLIAAERESEESGEPAAAERRLS